MFRPERFLGQNPPTNTWIPFGGGVRRCIGAGFSLMEGVAVLREVFTAYDVTAVGDDEPEGPQHHQRPEGRRPDPGGPRGRRLVAYCCGLSAVRILSSRTILKFPMPAWLPRPSEESWQTNMPCGYAAPRSPA